MKILSAFLFASTLAATVQVPPRLMRQHFQIIANGHTYEMTELVSQAPDRSDLITLFEAIGGQRYVFIYDENIGSSRTTFELRNLDRNLFLRGSYVLPYSGATPDEARAARARLTPQQFVVPFTIETNGFTDTERIDHWHDSEGVAHRNQLAQHINGDLMRSMQTIGIAFQAGSPAASSFCRYLGTIVTPGQACRRDRDLNVVPTKDDCSFDARFGYPCAH